MTSQSVAGRIKSLHRFPVKSMLGEDLSETSFATSGVVGDRAFAVLDRSDGRVASAKHPQKWRRLLQLHARYVDAPGPTVERGQLVVEFPDGASIMGDSPRLDAELGRLTGRDVTLVTDPTGSSYEAVWPDIEGAAPRELLEGLSQGRRADGETLTEIPVGSSSGTFVDLEPVHVLTTSSLDRLASLDPETVFDPRRYRPNVVLEVGADGFVENEWSDRTIALGRHVELRATTPTVRCVLPTLAHGDLLEDRGALRTLARVNRLDLPEFGGTWACLGAYATVAQEGSTRVGDEVRVRG